MIPEEHARRFLPAEWVEKIQFAEYVLNQRERINRLYVVTGTGLIMSTAICGTTIAAAITGESHVYIKMLCYSAAATAIAWVSNTMASRRIHKVDAEVTRYMLSHEND